MRPQVALVNTNPADNGKGDGDVKFRLEAIVVSGRQRTAVINGIGVSVGESIEGCRVKAITADAVLLAGKQGNKKLTLLSDESLLTHLQPEVSAQSSPPPAAIVPAAVQQALLPPLLPESVVGAPVRFDVRAEDVEASAFFAGLVKGTDTNMVIHPAVTGKITLHLKGVTLPEVLNVVQQVYGYHYRTIVGGYQVLPNEMQTRIYTVDYLTLKRSGMSLTRVSSGQVAEGSDSSDNSDDSSSDSSSSYGGDSTYGSQIETTSDSDFWTNFQTTLEQLIGTTDGRRVIVQPQVGLVVVRAMPEELDIVADYLRQTQSTLQRQVILEAKIIEVELSDGFQAGINWGALIHDGTDLARIGQVGGGTSISGGTSEISGSYTNLDPGAPSALSGLVASSFGGVFSAAVELQDFQAFIEAVKTQGDVQVLSSPRVSTVNNQKAVIKVGTDEFFVTDISSDTVTGTTTTTTPDITLTPFFSGIALDVTPQISDAGAVTLHIHPTVSEVVDQTKVITVSGQEQSLPLAFSSVRESDTIVRARSGQVVVIGGLMKNSTTTDTAAVPLLGAIPGIGRLFRQQKDVGRKSELIILLKPQVVQQDSDWADDMEQTQQRMRRLL
ncbi:MAG: pilus (MSHA type) biogenesis protein MshL [Desulfobacteraceae bacterium 4572_35.1]|nr:MAG: pilus (MSHA type) biogenesis protein MshL [Desulfobacteraceae bacterium 4572_35.1]